MYKEEIEIIKRKLENVKDIELKELIYKLLEERSYLYKISNIDPLTGLYNRRILEQIKKCNVVLLCDIDDFKSINDVYGHDVGDQVLQNIGEILIKNIRAGDYACRFGGDEFLVVFTNCEHDFIRERCEKIKQEIKDRICLPNHVVTISMGVAINYSNEQLESTIKQADEALYLSKSNGKNQLTFYEETRVK